MWLVNVYYESIFPVEDFSWSYDKQYGYIQLCSEKKTICSLGVKKVELTKDKEVRYSTDFFNLDIIFDDKDMEQISWGNDSYDLFFKSREKGVFVYKYDEDEWIGPLYLDKKRINDKQGAETYYFIGQIKNETTEDLPYYKTIETISVGVSEKTIPDNIMCYIETK